MRVIGGALSGRRLLVNLGPATRPTSDRVREAVASALQARSLVIGARVLDAFAGTGAYAIEAVSRGAAGALCVDNDRRAADCARLNVQALGLQAQIGVVLLDLLGPLQKVFAAIEHLTPDPFSLVFADPPYALAQRAADRLAELAERGLFSAGAHIVLEYASRTAPARPKAFAEVTTYRYGDTSVALWETIADPAQS